MERIYRPTRSQKIPEEYLDNLDIDESIAFNQNPKPEPKPKRKLSWRHNKAELKRGRVKIRRNKDQTEYRIEGLNKSEVNKVKELL